MFARGPLSIFVRRTFAVVVVLLLCGPSGECCGPGRRGGRRRSPRKLTPLVFKEHVPNVAETTLGASGLTEGHITKVDPRFHELVPNYNSDIYFRDEEGTGVDRLMTERCRERLNMLTISVMNTWANVRLRVIEGWEEGARHEMNSLHYEGRAVDISTSDRDRSKLGMLARLAVAAGFDWVYYESRSHIHCSVKSETSSRRRLGGCFPTYAEVRTPTGIFPIGMLKEGDFVQVLREDGSLGFSPVLLFIHKDAEESRSFLQLGTSSGKKLTLTPSHLVFVVRKEVYFEGVESDILLWAEGVLAGSVNPGDYLLTTVNNSVVLDTVISFDAAWLNGVFAPLTKDGTIVVNSVVASCYAVIDSQTIAHWAFLPVRLYYRVKDIAWSLIPSIGMTSDLTKNHLNPLNPKHSFNSIQINSIEKHIKYMHSDKKSRRIIEKQLNTVSSKYKLYPNSIKNYRKTNKMRSKLFTNDSMILAHMSKMEHQSHIHWYAKFLYQIAYWILPKHLVYA